MKSRRHRRRAVRRFLHMHELAARPIQQRTDAEAARLAALLDSIPSKEHQTERSGAA